MPHDTAALLMLIGFIVHASRDPGAGPSRIDDPSDRHEAMGLAESSGMAPMGHGPLTRGDYERVRARSAASPQRIT